MQSGIVSGRFGLLDADCAATIAATIALAHATQPNTEVGEDSIAGIWDAARIQWATHLPGRRSQGERFRRAARSRLGTLQVDVCSCSSIARLERTRRFREARAQHEPGCTRKRQSSALAMGTPDRHVR